LRETVRENGRLQRAKQAEIDTWKGDYEGRVAQRNTAQVEHQNNLATQVQSIARKTLDADIAELAKTIPYVLPPPAPDPKEAPAIQAAKQKALDEFNAIRAKVETDAKAWSTVGVTGDKAVEAHGKLAAAAVKGAVLTHHVLPRLLRENQANLARVTELSAELDKIKKAGATSRAHATAAAAPTKTTDIPANLSTVDAMTAFAKSQGVSIN